MTVVQDADELMAEYNDQLRQNEELDAQRASDHACGRLLRRNFSVMDKVSCSLLSKQPLVFNVLLSQYIAHIVITVRML